MHAGPSCRQELSRAVHLPPRLSPACSDKEGLNCQPVLELDGALGYPGKGC